MPVQAVSEPRSACDEVEFRLKRGREILRKEEAALRGLSGSLDASFAEAVEKLLACRGSVVVTGMGKAGIIGQKISASLASTGTPSHFLHPGEAVHGDLGRLRPEDIVMLLSASGETEEIVRVLQPLRQRVAGTLAITCQPKSSLARGVDLVLAVGDYPEACSHGLAPSTSTTLMMALGDALALVTSDCRGFTSKQFAGLHPAGSLGKRLTNIKDVMRPLSQCRVASESLSVREAIVRVSLPGRRTGAVMLTNEAGQLVGIYTDSDLARLLEHGGTTENGDQGLDQPIAQVMSREFQTVSDECFLPEAIRKLTEFKISELPVIDRQQCPLGLVDITDLLDSGVSVGSVAGELPASRTDLPKSSNRQTSNTQSPNPAGSDPEQGPRIIKFNR